jgi:hypothetical protein
VVAGLRRSLGRPGQNGPPQPQNRRSLRVVHPCQPAFGRLDAPPACLRRERASVKTRGLTRGATEAQIARCLECGKWIMIWTVLRCIPVGTAIVLATAAVAECIDINSASQLDLMRIVHIDKVRSVEAIELREAEAVRRRARPHADQGHWSVARARH